MDDKENDKFTPHALLRDRVIEDQHVAPLPDQQPLPGPQSIISRQPPVEQRPLHFRQLVSQQPTQMAPSETSAETSGETSGEQPIFKPMRISRDQMIKFDQQARKLNLDPVSEISRTILKETVHRNNLPSDLLTYDKLRKGTTGIFEKPLSDYEILHLVATDTEGRKITKNNWLKTLKYNAAPAIIGAVGTAAGGSVGFTAGLATGPAAPFVAVGGALTLGAIGYDSGTKTGDEITKFFIGKEPASLPEKGGTAMSEALRSSVRIGPSLLSPAAWGRKAAGSVGTLKNFMRETGVTSPGLVNKVLLSGEESVRKVGKFARSNPLKFTGARTLEAGGLGAGAYIAETAYPGDPWVRVGAETAGGGLTSIGVSVLSKPADIAIHMAKKFSSGNVKASEKSLIRAANNVRNVMKQYPGQFKEIQGILGSDITDKLIKARHDELTLGSLTDNPVVLGLERSIGGFLGTPVGKLQNTKLKKATQEVGKILNDAYDSGDPEFISKANDALYDIFYNRARTALSDQAQNFSKAIDKIDPTGKTSLAENSTALSKMVRKSYELARSDQKKAWNIVNKNIDYTPDEPSNVTKVLDGMSSSPQYMASATSGLKHELSFFKRMKNAESGSSEGITSGEMLEMRRLLVNKADNAFAHNNTIEGTAINRLKNALSEDLRVMFKNTSDDDLKNFQIADMKTIAINNAFTDSFVGKTTKLSDYGSSATTLPVTELARRVFTGNPDERRANIIKAYEEAGKYISNEIGAPESGNYRDHLSSMMRHLAENKIIDPKTGYVNQDNLTKWLKENKQSTNALDVTNALNKLDTPEVRLGVMTFRGGEEITQAQNAFLKKTQMENPSSELNTILKSDQPVAGLNNLSKFISSGETERVVKNAKEGLKSYLTDNAITGSTKDGIIDFNQVHNELFNPIPNSKGKISLIDWMIHDGIVTKEAASEYKRIIDYGRRLQSPRIVEEVAAAIPDPGKAKKVIFSILGAKFLTEMFRTISNRPPGLVIPAAGASAGRDALGIGNIITANAMSDLLGNIEVSRRIFRHIGENPADAGFWKSVQRWAEEEALRTAGMGVLSGVAHGDMTIDPVGQAEAAPRPVQPQMQPTRPMQLAPQPTQPQHSTIPRLPPMQQPRGPVTPSIQPRSDLSFSDVFPNDITSNVGRDN